ncbi:MAG: class I adenylate-forming enzyme family protein [Actinophytocola sp.]|uniref:class I adenylate-forming enzyme family protein n=1 Tax=Actinophytocola sp. TaxID=1872138 RepID=UPI003D6A6BBE
MSNTLYSQLLLTADRFPDREAIVHNGTRLTWSELRGQVDGVAAGLLDLEVQRGDKVAVWLPNIPEWPVVWLATTSIGATLVPINTRYQTGEAAYLIEQSGARVLFHLPEFLGTDYTAMVEEIQARQPGLRHVVTVGDDTALTFNSLAATPMSDRLAKARAAAEPSDDIILLYTSGTTGVPKGVRHRHEALADVAAMARLMSVSSSDRLLAHMPFFHVAGSFMAVLTALHTGCTLVCVDRFTGETALRTVQAEQCTVVNGVPSHFIMMLTALDQNSYDLRSVRVGWIAGSTIPADLVRGVRERFGMDLVVMYGLTETTGVATATRPDDPLDALLETVGTPIGNDYEVAIFDPGSMQPTAHGAEGEVWIRGHRVTSGYHRMPQQTIEALRPDGWFRSGDLGLIRADGRLRITGRLKDIFIVGGTNVSPAEIERTICELGAVAQAQVVGIPDDRLGEVGMAFVQLRPGQNLRAEDVVDHCARRLARYKVPQRVEFLTDFPTTAAGKVQKFKLREYAMQS